MPGFSLRSRHCICLFPADLHGKAVELHARVGGDKDVLVPVDDARLDEMAVFRIDADLDLGGLNIHAACAGDVRRAKGRPLPELFGAFGAESFGMFGADPAVFQDIAHLPLGESEGLGVLALLVQDHTLGKLLMHGLHHVKAAVLFKALAQDLAEHLLLPPGGDGGFGAEDGVKLSYFRQYQPEHSLFYNPDYNLVRRPFGYDNTILMDYHRLLLEYALPIYAGDINGGFFFYLKRILLIPFVDAARDLRAPIINNDNVITGFGPRNFLSYGTRLMFNTYLFRIGTEFKIGVQYSRTYDSDKWGSIRLVFSTGL